MTVSHALKGRKGSMSAATYERVMQAVRDLNYVPVHTATQNRHTETRALGVVPFHANLSSHEIDSYTYGGITEGAHAAEKIAAGASLVQIYSGFIYKGPALIREAVDAIAQAQRAGK